MFKLKEAELAKIRNMIKLYLYTHKVTSDWNSAKADCGGGDPKREQARIIIAQEAVIRLYNVIDPNTEFLNYLLKSTNSKPAQENINNIIALTKFGLEIDPAIKLAFIEHTMADFNRNAFCLYVATLEADKNREEYLKRLPDIKAARITLKRTMAQYPGLAKTPDTVSTDFEQLNKYDIAVIRANVFITALRNISRYLEHLQTTQKFNNKQKIGMKFLSDALNNSTDILNTNIVTINDHKEFEYNRLFNLLWNTFYEFSIKKNGAFWYSNLDTDVDNAIKRSPDKWPGWISGYRRAPLYKELGNLLPGKQTTLFHDLAGAWTEENYGRLDDKTFVKLVFMGRDLGYYDEKNEKLVAALIPRYIEQYLIKMRTNYDTEMAKETPDSKTIQAGAKAAIEAYDKLQPSAALLYLISPMSITIKERGEPF